MQCAPASGIHVRSWLAMLLAAGLVSGCGGSSGSGGSVSGDATVAATGSEALVRADAICRRLNSELLANLPKHVTPRTVAVVSPRNAVLEQRAVHELAKLQPPAAIAREWQQVISYRRTMAHALTELAVVAKAGNKAGMEKLGKDKEHVRKELLVVGRRIGFTSCQQLG